MNVALTSDLERRIADRVEAGLSASPAAVVQEALHLLFERDALKANIEAGFAAAERGELRDGPGSRGRVDAAITARRATTGR